MDRILSLSNRTLASVNDICETVFASLDYGLRLLGQKRDDNQVVIPAYGVDEPDSFIADTLDESYKL